MTEKTATGGAPTLLVPRFVRGLNAIAERAGFSTEVTIGIPERHDGQPRIVSTWRGPREAFMRLDFLSRTMLRKVHNKTSIISWPDRDECWHPVIYGKLEVQQSGVELRVSGGPVPRSIGADGGVEVVEYADEIAYHGTKEDLIRAGICTARSFPNKNVGKQSRGGADDVHRHWMTRRYPDGRYVHWLETAEAHAKRMKDAGERNRAQERDSPRDDTVKSAEEYRWLLQNFMPAYSRLGPTAVSKFDGLRGVDGYLYCITPESRERIEEALEEFLAVIHDAEIYRRKFDARSDEEKSAARELLARAEGDPAFQVFLSKLTPRS